MLGEVELRANSVEARPDGWRVALPRRRSLREPAASRASAATCRAASRSSTPATGSGTTVPRSPPTASSRAKWSRPLPRRTRRAVRGLRRLLRRRRAAQRRRISDRPPPPRAVRLRRLDGALPSLQARPREPLARGRPPPGRRNPRGSHRACAGAGCFVDPLDARIEAGRPEAARPRIRARALLPVRRAGDSVLRRLVPKLGRLPPADCARPVRGPRLVDHGAAGFTAMPRSRSATG